MHTGMLKKKKRPAKVRKAASGTLTGQNTYKSEPKGGVVQIT